MAKYIDRLAYVYLKNKRVLVTLTKGKTAWYIPGGKREAGESDAQALIREVKEELHVDLLPETIKKYGIFKAQVHDMPKGVMVQAVYYQADFKGELTASNEIEAIDFFAYKQKSKIGFVGQLLFDDLYKKGLIE